MDAAQADLHTLMLGLNDDANAPDEMDSPSAISLEYVIQDRDVMKDIFRGRLKRYSHLLAIDINLSAEFAKVPATSQIAIRAQDSMRNAKCDLQLGVDAIQREGV
jgi:hypothetical protein